MKMNSFTDRRIIDRIAKASEAGVKIKMIIRGICCIIPGLKDKTDNVGSSWNCWQVFGTFKELCFWCW